MYYLHSALDLGFFEVSPRDQQKLAIATSEPVKWSQVAARSLA